MNISGRSLALASRGDALTPYLFDALRRRLPIVGEIKPELTHRQRYQVAALTVRPTRSKWVEKFYKSAYAARLRTANAASQLRALPARPDLVFQVHALFTVDSAPTIMYIDCTHRQSAALWPAWNPLRGAQLDRWYSKEQTAYRSAEHIFAFCEPTRRSLIDDYGVSPERVTVTGAAPALAELPPPRVPGASMSGPPTILMIGNDFVRKGGPELLEAFRTVRADFPDARLRLVGTTPAVRPQPGVEVLGRIRDRVRIAQLYREATVFAMPSLFDPLPIAMLEAMAFGLPVVGTRQMGMPEVIDDGRTGYLVDPGRSDQLAEALLRVFRNPSDAGRVGAAARREIESRFTWDLVVGRMSPALQALSALPSQ